MKRTIIAAAVLALGTAGAGVSLADPGPGNSGDHALFGLCKAAAASAAHGNNDGKGPFTDELADACGDDTPETAGGTHPGGGH